MRNITLSETTVAQSLDFDQPNQWMYVGQIIQGGRQLAGEPAPVSDVDRVNNGDISINRLNMDGTLDSNMYIRGAGHGTSVAVAPDGRLWIDADSSSSGFARAVSLITFQPGVTTDSNLLAIYRPFGPASGSHGLSIYTDLRFGKVMIRRSYPEGDPNARRYYLYHLDAVMLGDFSTPLFQVDQPANQPPDTPGGITTFQGGTTYGDYLYSLEGDPNISNTYISRLRWDTGVTESKVLQATIFDDITYREPEGMSLQNFPGNHNANKLVFGFASGPGGGRKYNLAFIPTLGAS